MNNPNILIAIPFAGGANGFKNTIQENRQAGQDEADATWSEGFPNITMIPIDMGGQPPKGLDFNGIFHAISSNTAFVTSGGRYKFDAEYAEKIGGYDIGAIVMSDDNSVEYLSIVDNNKNNPNVNIDGWRVWGGVDSIKNATTEQTGILKLAHSGVGFSIDEQKARSASAWWVAQLQIKVDRTPPPGAVMHFAGSVVPDGWLKANGQAVSRATYKDLFAAIGTTYGAGDGVKTFNLPDLRGEFIRGWDDGRGIDNQRIAGSSQSDAVQSHNHFLPTGTGEAHPNPDKRYAIPDETFTNTTVNYNSTSGTTNTTYPNPDYYQPDHVGNIGRFAPETRPRNIALLACIKY